MSASAADPDKHPPVNIVARGVGFTFRPYCGIVSDFVIQDQGRRISLMHKAPWVGENIQLPSGAPPHQAYLEGDFFCAPFSDASAQEAPLHGWPANDLWEITPSNSPNSIQATLPHLVNGALLTKSLFVQDDHPFLYQSHIFHGGLGSVSAANHAMLSLPNGGFLRYSPKQFFLTLSTAPETEPSRGRSCLRYPAQTSDPHNFPAANGETIDITRYPFGPAHDDFVIGLEAPNSPLGWTAVTRPLERDLYLSLRHPRRTPMTMLWHSNGGRDYAPWSRRHLNCLGIEEGIWLGHKMLS